MNFGELIHTLLNQYSHLIRPGEKITGYEMAQRIRETYHQPQAEALAREISTNAGLFESERIGASFTPFLVTATCYHCDPQHAPAGTLAHPTPDNVWWTRRTCRKHGEVWHYRGKTMTYEEIYQRLRKADDGDQVPFPDEATKERAWRCWTVAGERTEKVLYLTTQEDYELWLRSPKAPTPGM